MHVIAQTFITELRDTVAQLGAGVTLIFGLVVLLFLFIWFVMRPAFKMLADQREDRKVSEAKHDAEITALQSEYRSSRTGFKETIDDALAVNKQQAEQSAKEHDEMIAALRRRDETQERIALILSGIQEGQDDLQQSVSKIATREEAQERTDRAAATVITAVMARLDIVGDNLNELKTLILSHDARPMLEALQKDVSAIKLTLSKVKTDELLKGSSGETSD